MSVLHAQRSLSLSHTAHIRTHESLRTSVQSLALVRRLAQRLLHLQLRLGRRLRRRSLLLVERLHIRMVWSAAFCVPRSAALRRERKGASDHESETAESSADRGSLESRAGVARSIGRSGPCPAADLRWKTGELTGEARVFQRWVRAPSGDLVDDAERRRARACVQT